MVNKTWKNLERKVAHLLQGRRNPLSGSMSGHGTCADVIDHKILPGYFVECKLRQAFGHHALFRVVEGEAKKEGKLPLLVTKRKGETGELAVLRLTDLVELIK